MKKVQNFLLILPIESGIIKVVQKTMRRCVGMADEGDSKSLVLITRVGSTPTTGIASSSKSKDFGLFFFFCSVSYTLVFSGKILTIAFAEDTLLEKSRCVWI